jgi:hypothetical protein
MCSRMLYSGPALTKLIDPATGDSECKRERSTLTGNASVSAAASKATL